MTRLRRTALIIGLIATSLAGCATSPLPNLAPGERPETTSDEAGLWMVMDREEERLKTSGNLVRDPQLNAYVRDLVCKLAGPRCGEIRVYIVREPRFNASMAPNGTMIVWTGTLLRARNEAQLAAILAHELSHYIRRHSLQNWRDARSKTTALTFVQLAAGSSVIGAIAPLFTYASIMANSRENEREADSLGQQIMVENGYDPSQAAAIWRQLVRENAAADEPDSRIAFLDSHPASEERLQAMQTGAAQMLATGFAGKLATEEYRAAVLPYRGQYLKDDLALAQYRRSAELLAMLKEDGASLSELQYFEGELYRQRNKEGDAERAITAYRQAAGDQQVPPELHRSLGLVYMKTGQTDEARRELQRYLNQRPDAPDRKVIGQMLGQGGN